VTPSWVCRRPARMREFVGWIKPVKIASMILIMTHDALHSTEPHWPKPRWHNSEPRWPKPRWHKLNLVGTIEQFVYIAVYNCRLDGTIPPHPDNEQGAKIDLRNTHQVQVGVTGATEEAGVVRSSKDMVRLLR
jgi:hypothetical protein